MAEAVEIMEELRYRTDILEKKLLYAQKLRDADSARIKEGINNKMDEISFLKQKKQRLIEYKQSMNEQVWKDLIHFRVEGENAQQGVGADGSRVAVSMFDIRQSLGELTTKDPRAVIDDATKEQLKMPTFDNWQYTEDELASLIELMFHELGLIDEFKINPYILRQFISRVHENYNNNPFHNFIHCFCVTQMMYSLINITKIYNRLKKIDILILITSAICHDLDHPGYNNSYQINAQTELAIRYNDVSPLENHHCAVAFTILSEPGCNIFCNVDKELFKKIRQGMITCILATDMARHGDIMGRWKAIVGEFSWENESHRILLMQLFIKCVDISNEVRPTHVSEPWVDCLLEEFFNQSDTEKQLGLPVAPFMDREKVTKSKAQIGFIQFVLIPLFEAVTRLFPELDEPVLQSIRASHQYYVNLSKSEAAAAAGQNNVSATATGATPAATNGNNGNTLAVQSANATNASGNLHNAQGSTHAVSPSGNDSNGGGDGKS